jgi:lysophospholipase L1-like esterase
MEEYTMKLLFDWKLSILRIVTVVAGCLVLHSAVLLKAADETAPASATKQNSATTPVFHAGTTPKHEKINARAKEGDLDLIFIGDSITEGWAGQGKKTWEKYYGNRKAMNAGVGGDRTQHVLWRLDNGNVEGIHPKLAVIMIGTNNSNNKDNTAVEIAEGIKAIVHEVREKLPETKILLLGIFPRGATTDEQLEKIITHNGQKEIEAGELPSKIAAAREATIQQRQKNVDASRLASEVADNTMVFYMDIGPKFLDAEGVLSKDIMPDYLHPNAKGYEIWAEAIEPKVAELLGENK